MRTSLENDSTMVTRSPTAFATLRGLLGRVPATRRCELCAAVLPEEHSHLLELASRQLRCACGACAILFSGQENGRYRRMVPKVERLPNFRLPDAQWEALAVPIGLAFLFQSTLAGRPMALFPSPAGGTEALLPPVVWQTIVADNPRLVAMEPDVEALLVNRLNGARDYFLVSIDECFKLIGLIRLHWKGLSGGQEAREAIEGFFQGLKQRAGEVGHA